MKKTILYTILLGLFPISGIWAESYTLDGFLKDVYDHSKQLKLAKEDLNYAGANKKEAVAGALPDIKASAGYNRNLNDTYLYVNLGGEPSKLRINKNNEYSMNVTLDQTLFSGAVYNAIKAAKEYDRATEFMYEASEDEIISTAKKSFYQTLLLKEVYSVAKKSEQNAYDNFIEVQNGFASGLKSEFEKLQAEARYKELIPQTTQAERNYNIALLNLKNMAGIDPNKELSLVGELKDTPPMPDRIAFDSVLNRRPDYNAIIWEERLRATGVRAEQAGRFPTLDGFFSYNYSAQSDQFKLQEENNNYVVGLKLSLPLFTGGRTGANIQKAKIELNKTKINRAQAVDNIRTELANIRLRLHEAHSRIESAGSSLETAQKAFDIAEATTKAGLTTQLELKDSRTTLDRAQVNYYSAIYEYLDAYFDWEKSVGQVTYAD